MRRVGSESGSKGRIAVMARRRRERLGLTGLSGKGQEVVLALEGGRV